MSNMPDMELVQEFARSGSETAFGEIVRRHLNLVYSVAHRCTGNDGDAQDVTQAVFIVLARKAGGLSAKTVLPGWLYETTRYTAARLRRTDTRRHAREQEAYMQSTLTDGDTTQVWAQLAPHLEAAMSGLAERDRALLVLHFYQNQTAAQAAAQLGIREDAAHKRVARALEKLRKFFTQRGVTLTAAAIAGAVSANSIQAAPAGLAKIISLAAVAKRVGAGTATSSLVKGTWKLMAWSKAKTTMVTAAVMLCAAGGTGLYIYQTIHPSPAAELRAALQVPKPPNGSWQYPTVQVGKAIKDFGSNRAEAFPILERAVRGADPEARKQAMAAMGMIVQPAMTASNLYARFAAHNVDVKKIDPRWLVSLQSAPATNALPFLREILFANTELSSFALSSLHGMFETDDISALADLLVQSHNDQSSQPATSHLPQAAPESVQDKSTSSQQLQRYLPEAIADIISRNPDTVAPFISPVEDLLDDPNADIRFGAACALVKYKGVTDARMAKELITGLKSRHDNSRPYLGTEVLKQVMAIETLQRIGPDAKPMVPALLEYADSIQDKSLRELAFRAAGNLDSTLRNTMPEVDQAVKNDPALKNAITPR
ncbi:MAG: sigma-70 family RNA polymerase sigma factor [Verrucomicrobiae bacterium]|nr:sigma-70 family RNA polymerase sigma factor [Verrucomicrobiae bacterium]